MKPTLMQKINRNIGIAGIIGLAVAGVGLGLLGAIFLFPALTVGTAAGFIVGPLAMHLGATGLGILTGALGGILGGVVSARAAGHYYANKIKHHPEIQMQMAMERESSQGHGMSPGGMGLSGQKRTEFDNNVGGGMLQSTQERDASRAAMAAAGPQM